MAALIHQVRKSAVLSRPLLPCISMHHTINLTAGCIFGCKYCYAQGYRQNLGPGKILFYANSYEKLAKELPRKKVKPQIVYFSTASEPFAPFAKVLDELYKIMELLLSNSIAVYISTKGYIPDKFINLFGASPELVFAQIGITTIDDTIRKIFEPRAAPVKIRLNNINRLLSKRVFTEARLDPIIPGVTDKELSIENLFKALETEGCREAVASYLFLRPSNRKAFYRAIPTLEKEVDNYISDRIENYCHGNSIQVVSRGYREQKYRRFYQKAEEHGINLKFCSCKNPEFTKSICHPQAIALNKTQSQLIFQNEKEVEKCIK